MANNSSETQVDVVALANSVAVLQSNNDHFFLLVMGCLVFFMQCGFAFLEAGSVRSKNTTNILIKNLLDVSIGAIAYYAVGYAFSFGSGNFFIGYEYFFMIDMPTSLYSHWFFQFVFAATATTIVSGAMAERTEFVAYFIYSCIITGFIYPVVTHWAWSGEGWLTDGPPDETLQYSDFAGSGVVHVVGGAAGFVGAAIIGPRIGRFVNGKPVEIPGHTVPLSALGGFILMFGFFAFNGGSQAQISQPGDGVIVALAIVNTTLSGCIAAIVALILKRSPLNRGYPAWSLLATINGALTGMVAICAGCNVMEPWGAAITGLIAGFTYFCWSKLVLYIGVDDPLDAVAVHLGGGLWGVCAVTLFAKDTGVVYKFNEQSWKQFGWNAVGGFAIMTWTMIVSAIMFGILHLCRCLRVSKEIEIKGLDVAKHKEPAYPSISYGDGWGLDAPLVNGNGSVNTRDVNLEMTDVDNAPKDNAANGKTDEPIGVDNPTYLESPQPL
ncbi:putative ammonium transporter 1 [Glandiceps talaboti]